MLLEPARKRIADYGFHDLPDFRRNELILGLAGKFRVRHFDRKHGGQSFAAVFTGKIDLLLFSDTGCFRVADHFARESRGEAVEVSATVALRNVIRETEDAFVIAVIPGQRRLDHDLFALAAHYDRRRDQGLLAAVEIADEFLDAAFVAHLLVIRFGAAP